jgi:hypothetical protein
MPTREEIEEAARKLFMEERAKKGLPPSTPTEEELKEGSYWERARRELMATREKALAEQRKYVEEMAAEFGLRVVPEEQLEKMLEPTEEAAKLRAEIERLRREAEEAKRIAEEERRRAEEAQKAVKILRVEAVPPPVAPPPAPPPITARRKERMVISPECNEIFKRLWKEVEKAASLNVGAVELGTARAGGVAMIRKSLSRAFWETNMKIERLANELLECECSLRMPEEGGK